MALPPTLFYATPADVVSRYDIRRVAQLCSYDGTPITESALNTTSIAYTTDTTVILKMIQDASNKVLMSCRVANRYRQSDLDAVYGDVDRGPSLIRLVCDLVFGYLNINRGLSLEEVLNQAPMFKDALDTLELLKRGDRVFDDAPPPGTDAPTAGAKVDIVGTSPSIATWSQQTNNQMFPICGLNTNWR